MPRVVYRPIRSTISRPMYSKVEIQAGLVNSRRSVLQPAWWSPSPTAWGRQWRIVTIDAAKVITNDEFLPGTVQQVAQIESAEFCANPWLLRPARLRRDTHAYSKFKLILRKLRQGDLAINLTTVQELVMSVPRPTISPFSSTMIWSALTGWCPHVAR